MHPCHSVSFLVILASSQTAIFVLAAPIGRADIGALCGVAPLRYGVERAANAVQVVWVGTAERHHRPIYIAIAAVECLEANSALGLFTAICMAIPGVAPCHIVVVRPGVALLKQESGIHNNNIMLIRVLQWALSLDRSTKAPLRRIY